MRALGWIFLVLFILLVVVPLCLFFGALRLV